MTGMSFEPVETDPVPAVNRKEALPKIRILNLLPSFPLPTLEPTLVDRLDHIGGITEHLYHGIIPLYGLQSFYHGQKFHTVIGCPDESAAHLFLMSSATKDHSISSGTRITARGTISVKEYGWSVFVHEYKYKLKFLGNFIFVTIFGI